MTTFSMVSRLLPLLEEAQARAANRDPANTASREFAIAAHSLEDAIMRINMGFAKLNGTQQYADVQVLHGLK